MELNYFYINIENINFLLIFELKQNRGTIAHKPNETKRIKIYNEMVRNKEGEVKNELNPLGNFLSFEAC